MTDALQQLAAACNDRPRIPQQPPTRRGLLALPGDWMFDTNGTERAVDANTQLAIEGQEPAQAGVSVRARYLDHRVTRRGTVYTWALPLTGGIFERLGLPEDAHRAAAL